MHTSAGGEVKKKKKAKVLCAQTDDCVCFGCCQQWGRAIYALVLKGGRAFDPCDVIFFVSGTRYRLPYPLQGKKNNLTQVFWTGGGGVGLAVAVLGDILSMSEHCTALSRLRTGAVSHQSAYDQWIDWQIRRHTVSQGRGPIREELCHHYSPESKGFG